MSRDALLSHLLARMDADIDLFVQEQLISVDDARVIRGRLPASPAANQTALARVNSSASTVPSLASLALSSAPAPLQSTPQPPRAVPPPPVSSSLRKVEALWPYNSGTPGDLAFPKGAHIDLLEECNDHWQRGRYEGREGLYPSNHVRPLTDYAGAPPPSYGYAPATSSSYAGSTYGGSEGEKMGGPMVPMQQHHHQQQQMAPIQQQPVAVEAPPKKKFGGGMGNTLAHAAVGGVGFGAGSAAASELIHAIF